MASTAAAGVFNAFAFAGAGFIFSKLNHSGYESEMHRHNLAMEKLTKAREKWNESRLKELDRLSKLRYSREDANRDLVQTNKALLSVKTKFEKDKPVLSNFYTPSKEMDEYLTVVKFLATIPVLYGVSALVL